MRRGVSYLVGMSIGLVIMVVSSLPSDSLRMVVCDVGQGDAILLVKGKSQVLVDGGPSGAKVLECLRKYVPFWDRKIEVVVLTSSDADHLAGLIHVIPRYQIDEFLTGDSLHQSDTFNRFLRVLREEGVIPQGVEAGDRVLVGDIVMDVLWPDKLDPEVVSVFDDFDQRVLRDKSGSLNERSVVLMVRYNGKRALLTGDIGERTERALLGSGVLEDVDVLKVGHHGSKYSSTSEFLELIKPQHAVISVGEGNRYGHPTSETLNRLIDVGSEIRRTDKEGDVVYEF